MRNNALKATAILAFAVFTFSSCRKCTDCVNGSTTQELCDDEFVTDEEYNNSIAALEGKGYTCTAR